MSSSLWPYRYTSPTPDQLRERRELLTLRGQYAQLSVLVFLLMLGVYRLATRKSSSSSAAGTQKRTPKSSWLDTPLEPGAPESRRQYLVAGAWFVWLLALSVWRTGDDYLHLTKSLAHTTLATLPLHPLLAPKLSPQTNPFTLLHTRLFHLPQTHLTPYHRLFGWLVFPTLLFLHAGLYVTFFMQKGLLQKRLGDADVQWGFVAVTGLVGLVGVARWMGAGMGRGGGGGGGKGGGKGWMRGYVVHVGLVMGVLGAVYCHVEYARGFVGWTLVVYGVDVGSWVVKRWLR
ncbi:hypothetical protein AJ79_01227 [Helicocarpus griseus UAMH5409]|uniref:Ferric oxidoreductase domain-containing protein n=1 Tax=Helicocarpus griseus UAMH5409 TaxID=1447875 RepID=A0A2B7Y8I1_9EURO|nr:hypothetical protein AJ79_01227 [Helicocarpus griseus UAMH5409]